MCPIMHLDYSIEYGKWNCNLSSLQRKYVIYIEKASADEFDLSWPPSCFRSRGPRFRGLLRLAISQMHLFNKIKAAAYRI